MVGISNNRKEDRTVYGAVLYLDGKRVPGKKTFTGRTLFQGYKKGGGVFVEFGFNTNNGGIMNEHSGSDINSSANQ